MTKIQYFQNAGIRGIYMIQPQKIKEYEELIRNNRILAEYIRTHNLSIEEIKNLIEGTENFFIRVLTDNELYDKVMLEVYHYLKDL